MNTLIHQPKVIAVGKSEFIKNGLDEWIQFNGLEELTTDNTPLSDLWDDVSKEDSIARMIEFSGRHCYRAWEKGRSRSEYIKNIIEMEHGSVLEHSTINWAIQGISRSLSLELVRHRVGVAISQESQRYVDASEINFVVPPIVLDMDAVSADDTLLSAFFEEAKYSLRPYRALQSSIVEYYSQLNPEDIKGKTMLKKRANEAARALLPNCAETRMVWTTNMRLLLHFLWLRGGAGADLEIRRLAVALLKEAQVLAPEIFNSMTTKEVPDGYSVPIIVSADQ